jgi:succinate-semialdehyde dehydrogenase/glutarate-semialdehyde dehydrogenase
MSAAATTPSARELLRDRCYINGRWVNADDGRIDTIRNPANGEVLGTVPHAGRAETRRAIDAARNAFPAWSARSGKERSAVLRRFYDLVVAHREDLATLITLEEGKPIAEARSEIDYAAGFIEWNAEEAKRVYGDTISAPTRDRRIVVLKVPVGVCAAITPWNFPAAMIARKVGPALATGCTMVLKPAPQTPFTALALCELAERAGLPAGVLSCVTGDAVEIGGELTTNPTIRKLSFTGSTAVGKLLMQQCAGSVKRLSLELGGNAPFIVFADADLDAALAGAVNAKFRNTGQACISANRIYVQNSVYDAFAEKFAHAVAQLKVGNGFDADVAIGPLINEAALHKVELHVVDAISKGARALTGGRSHALGLCYYEPTVLADVTSEMLCTTEETFGPIAPLYRFDTEAEVVALANDTPYGLAAYFYSRDVQRSWRVAEALEYGMIGINEGLISTEVAPFGGVKESGLGREGSLYGIDEYLETKYLCLGGNA